MAGGLQTGTLTFLFTDVEGSTARWEADPDEMATALARHDELVRSSIHERGGIVFATGGDGFAAAFGSAVEAIGAAIDAQRRLADDDTTGSVRVRMGLHTGVAEARDGDFFGIEVNRAARLTSIAHGGQIVVSGGTARLVGDRVRLRPLGEHRLRDLSSPVPVSQVLAEGLDDEFPPLRSLDASPGNLPTQLTSFVGRSEERIRLRALLDDHRLVTLIGVGGTGKTRLAVQTAAEVVDDHPDGVWLAELALARSTDAVPEVILGALALRTSEGQSPEDRLVEYLTARRLLLVLDNCEHVLDEAAELVERLLRACPMLYVVATSREALGVGGEHLFHVPPLSAEGDAVSLFVERARAERGDFTPDDDELEVIADICRQLDGMPLAIELAAARCGALGVRDLSDRLEQRFRLLTGGRRRRVERHQTLQAAVDWSYRLLDESERLAFDVLSVFVGEFDLSDAVALLGPDGLDELECLDVVTSLAAKSMCAVSTSGETSRYRYLETIRAFGRDRLGSADRLDEMRDRHSAHFADVARATADRLVGPDELAAERSLDHRWPDLRSSFDWAVDRGSERVLESIAALACPLGWRGTFGPYSWFYERRDELTSSRARETAVAAGFMVARDFDYVVGEVDAILDDWSADSPPIDLLVAAGWTALWRGDADGCVAHMERLHRGARDAEDRRARLIGPWALAAAQAAIGLDSTMLATGMLRAARGARWPTAIGSALYALAGNVQRDAPHDALDQYQEVMAIGDAVSNGQLLLSAQREYIGLRLRLGLEAGLETDLLGLLRRFRAASNVADAVATMRHTVTLLARRSRPETAAALHTWLAEHMRFGAHDAHRNALEAALGDLTLYEEQASTLSAIEVIDIACAALEDLAGS